MESIATFFDSSRYLPHGHCFFWSPPILWTQVAADSLIAFAYLSIPMSISYLLKRRPELLFKPILGLFVAFILLCGTSHLSDVWTIWHPDYAMQAVLKAGAAAISVATAVTLWIKMPEIVSAPTAEQLRQANSSLRNEMQRSNLGRRELADKNAELSRRTQELEESNAKLKQQIAERLIAEQALARSEHELHLITDALPVGIIAMDMHEQYVFTNSTYAKWYGRQKADFAGLTVRQVVGERDYQRVQPSIQRALAGQANTIKTQLLTSQGAMDVDIQYIPDITPSGNIRGYFGLLANISEQVKQQQALSLARQTADEANRAKSTFLTNISHEIRTPIGVILNCSQRMLSTDLPLAERNRSAEMICRNSHNLLDLVNDILDLSKVEAGHVSIQKESFALLDFICDIIGQMRLKAEEKSLRLAWSVHGRLPITIASDRLRLRQVLQNLLSNAIKFTDKGQVHVDVGTTCDTPMQLSFTVADTGIGIGEAEQQRVFQPFIQADPSIVRRYGGTGLGLCLSRQLARNLGGDVKLVRSSPEAGSVFRATIDPGDLRGVPFVAVDDPEAVELERRAARAGEPTADVDLTKLRVLVVEDFEDNKEVLKALLVDHKATVDFADNGYEALAKALVTPFDVILMDIQMPVMDGYTATNKLREQGYAAPIIALTAHAMHGEVERCLASGFTGYLSKPIDRRRLLHTLSAYIPNTSELYAAKA